MKGIHPINPKPATFHSLNASQVKKRGHTSRSWIHIEKSGKSQIIELDKATIMRRSGLPARDLRLLDPLFVYPSTILGRERAIVVSLEQIRCIIMADEVFLMNSLDNCVLRYESELCRRLAMTRNQNQNDDLPFEFKALELALELSSTSLDAQVRDEIEQLMDDDEDMAEMYLTEKKERMEACLSTDREFSSVSSINMVSKSAPVSPTFSNDGLRQEKPWASTVMSSIKYESSRGSYGVGRQIEELEMLLEAYFVVVDSTLNKLLSLKEYIDDTEDFINIKLDNVRNQLIQFELLLTAATFVVTIFAVVTGVFGMNFVDSVFDRSSNFNLVLIIASVSCAAIYFSFLLYVKHKRLLAS
ncbi:magnesium transporter MRS2-5 isoform X2 [Asparagus officinalis]|uniref:magnesium transporter MRS2-5 isoform X2 n=1 Tax=Asparagus officinalis TaxID=4686 RepID=UPI00098E3761|nr:magnesium transporter MRS2-5 isoform X2 [Asparagus officinalis]